MGKGGVGLKISKIVILKQTALGFLSAPKLDFVSGNRQRSQNPLVKAHTTLGKDKTIFLTIETLDWKPNIKLANRKANLLPSTFE